MQFMSTGHPNQACAQSPTLASLGPSTPQNDSMNGGINLLYLTCWEVKYFCTHAVVLLSIIVHAWGNSKNLGLERGATRSAERVKYIMQGALASYKNTSSPSKFNTAD